MKSPPFRISLLQLPLLCREAFQSVVLTSATTRHGIEDLDKAILSLAGAPQVRAERAAVTRSELLYNPEQH